MIFQQTKNIDCVIQQRIHTTIINAFTNVQLTWIENRYDTMMIYSKFILSVEKKKGFPQSSEALWYKHKTAL